MHPKPNPGSWRKNSHIHRGSLGDFYQISWVTSKWLKLTFNYRDMVKNPIFLESSWGDIKGMQTCNPGGVQLLHLCNIQEIYLCFKFHKGQRFNFFPPGQSSKLLKLSRGPSGKPCTTHQMSLFYSFSLQLRPLQSYCGLLSHSTVTSIARFPAKLVEVVYGG